MPRRYLITLLSLAAVVGCSSESGPGPSGDIDYQGSWLGNIGDPAQVQRNSVQWTATHERNTVRGPFILQFGATLSATGTLTGTVVGDVIEFSLAINAGAFPSPVSPSCSMTATGSTTTATATSIVADLSVTFSPPCQGTVTTALTGTLRVTLLKSN